MSRPIFSVKVPSIPKRPRIRKRSKKREHKSEKAIQLDTIQEVKISDTRRSSYYSFTSGSSEPTLKVLETYEEFLNLRDLDTVLWTNTSNGFISDETEQSSSKPNAKEDYSLLKQICANLQSPLDILSPKKGFQVKSLFQAEGGKFNTYDMKTAIIAKRIVDTQEQLAKSRGSSNTGFSKEQLKRNSFNKYKSSTSMEIIEEWPCSSTKVNHSLSNTLSNLTSKYGLKRSKPQTCDLEVQVDLLPNKEHPIAHSCNTQTNPDVLDETQKIKNVTDKHIQITRKTKTKLVQSTITGCLDKFMNTDASFCPNQERFTQMYEHITENDLFCMEWIDKNLFRVPVNPDTIIVDERIKDSSEYSCQGTSFFEQELSWERQALCS